MVQLTGRPGTARVICRCCKYLGPTVWVSKAGGIDPYRRARIRALERGWTVINRPGGEFTRMVCPKCQRKINKRQARGEE